MPGDSPPAAREHLIRAKKEEPNGSSIFSAIAGAVGDCPAHRSAGRTLSQSQRGRTRRAHQPDVPPADPRFRPDDRGRQSGRQDGRIPARPWRQGRIAARGGARRPGGTRDHCAGPHSGGRSADAGFANHFPSFPRSYHVRSFCGRKPTAGSSASPSARPAASNSFRPTPPFRTSKAASSRVQDRSQSP